MHSTYGQKYYSLLSNAYKLKPENQKSTLRILLDSVGEELDRIQQSSNGIRDAVFPELVSGKNLDHIATVFEYERLPQMQDSVFRRILKDAHQLQIKAGTVGSIKTLCEAIGFKYVTVTPNLNHLKDLDGKNRWAEFQIILQAEKRFMDKDQGIDMIQVLIHEVKKIKPVWTKFEIRFTGDKDKSIRKWLMKWQRKHYDAFNEPKRSAAKQLDLYLSTVNFHYQDMSLGVPSLIFYKDSVKRHIRITFED